MWRGKKVLVTGGASFIGSHLVERLLELGAHVLVVDNFSSGRSSNLPSVNVDGSKLLIRKNDLSWPDVARAAMVDREVVFHLAANHGGRGYVDEHEVECAGNMILDQVVMQAAATSRHVKYVVNVSSACVYPLFAQETLEGVRRHTLREADVGPPYDADHLYGWAKLMGEFVMDEHIERGSYRGTSLRYFTVYGPRMGVSHAIGAWIAKAQAHQDPFLIWGDGQQTRSWVYVDDVVEATLASAENLILDASYDQPTTDDVPRVINIGSPDHVKVVDAALMVLEAAAAKEAQGWPGLQIDFEEGQPTGPRHRAADVSLAADALSWRPTTSLGEGLRKTVDWFYRTYTEKQARELLTKLKER